MSSLHLHHLISWNSLQSLLVTNDGDDGIELPVDSEGRIHIQSRAVGIQVEHRPYLQGRVCSDSSCQIVGTAVFYKRKKERFNWKIRLRTKEDHNQMRNLTDSFVEAVKELGSIRLQKAKEAVAEMTPAQRAKRFTEDRLVRAQCSYWGEWDILYELMAHSDLETILILDKEKVIDIPKLLSQYYGQAIGNGFKFLVVRHLLPFYLESNMMIAYNLQALEDKWHNLHFNQHGLLSFGLTDLSSDCDGRTFIEHLRPELSKGVYMRDLKKTKDLLKQTFDAITTYYTVCEYSSYKVDVKADFVSALGSAFINREIPLYYVQDDDEEFFKTTPLFSVFCS